MFSNGHYRLHTKLEVTEFIRSTDFLTFLGGDYSTSNHHGTDANHHNTSEFFGIDGNNRTNILPINIESMSAKSSIIVRGSDRHGIDSIVLPFDGLWFSKHAVNRDMKSMIILRSQSEDTKCATFELGGIFRIGRRQKSFHGEVTTFDPYFLSFLDFIKDHATAIGGRHRNRRVVWGCARASLGF